MANFILGAAIRAVKSRIGTWRAYDEVRSLVPEVTREQWSRAVTEAKTALAARIDELTRPLNRRPNASEFGPTIVRNSNANYWQHIEIYVRDKATGARAIRHFTTKTDTLRSRISVINDWIQHLQSQIDARPEDYPVDIIGFAYIGTYPIQKP